MGFLEYVVGVATNTVEATVRESVDAFVTSESNPVGPLYGTSGCSKL